MTAISKTIGRQYLLQVRLITPFLDNAPPAYCKRFRKGGVLMQRDRCVQANVCILTASAYGVEDSVMCPNFVSVETRSRARAALFDREDTALVLAPPPILIASASFGGSLATGEGPTALLCSASGDRSGLQCYKRYPSPISDLRFVAHVCILFAVIHQLGVVESSVSRSFLQWMIRLALIVA